MLTVTVPAFALLPVWYRQIVVFVSGVVLEPAVVVMEVAAAGGVIVDPN